MTKLLCKVMLQSIIPQIPCSKKELKSNGSLAFINESISKKTIGKLVNGYIITNITKLSGR